MVTNMVVLFLTVSVTVNAGPVLLASFDTTTNGGGAPESDPRLEFILQIPSTSPPTDFFGLGMGMDIFWREGDEGSFDFNASNDNAFDDFASHATDGINDSFMLWTLFPSGGGDGKLGAESDLFGSSSDLTGNNLEFVRLIVREIRLEPWIPDPVEHPEIEGFLFETHLTYEFYGSPIPEPATLILLAAGVLMVMPRRRLWILAKRRNSR